MCCFVFSGTCINNTSVMMFKKGSFEIGGTIYPVAIKVVHYPKVQIFQGHSGDEAGLFCFPKPVRVFQLRDV